MCAAGVLEPEAATTLPTRASSLSVYFQWCGKRKVPSFHVDVVLELRGQKFLEGRVSKLFV